MKTLEYIYKYGILHASVCVHANMTETREGARNRRVFFVTDLEYLPVRLFRVR